MPTDKTPEPECFQLVEHKQALIQHAKKKLLQHSGTPRNRALAPSPRARTEGAAHLG